MKDDGDDGGAKGSTAGMLITLLVIRLVRLNEGADCLLFFLRKLNPELVLAFLLISENVT